MALPLFETHPGPLVTIKICRMSQTETKSLYSEVPQVLISQLEAPVSGRTLELMSYVEDEGPGDIANLITFYACMAAENKETIDLFDRNVVRMLLRLQEFLLSWQNDLVYDEIHQREESAKTGLAEDE